MKSRPTKTAATNTDAAALTPLIATSANAEPFVLSFMAANSVSGLASCESPPLALAVATRRLAASIFC